MTAAGKFDVRTFGARGDGQSDDTAAAQAAIDAAVAARAGHVHFPAGDYRILRSLRIAGTVRIDITGAGNSSTLLHENDEHLLLWPEGSVCKEVTVRNLRLCSVAADKSHDVAAIACLGGVERSMFENLYIVGDARVGSGIITEGNVDTMSVENCLLWRVSGVGVRVAGGCEVRIVGGRIIGDDSLSNPNIGVHIIGNGGVHIVTTDLIALNTALKIGEPGHTKNREIFITHATLDSCRHGLWQVDGAYTSIAGCWAASSDDEQILLDSTAAGAILSVAGGTIYHGGAHGRPGSHHGIVVRAGSFSLTGVSVRENLGVGILVEDGVADYTITGCRVHDNGLGARLCGRRGALTGNLFVNNRVDLEDRRPAAARVDGNVFESGGGA